MMILVSLCLCLHQKRTGTWHKSVFTNDNDDKEEDIDMRVLDFSGEVLLRVLWRKNG